MNELKRVNKTTSFLTITLTSFLFGLMFVTMLMSVNFDITQINWFDFGFAVMNWIVARSIYFPVGIDIGNGEEKIQLMVGSVNRYRNIIYKNKINKEFREKIEKHNKIAKCSAYMDFVDNKLSTVKNAKQLLKWNEIKIDLLELMPLLEKNKMADYKGKINLDTLKIKYDKLEFANIFSFGEVVRRLGEKYTFNAGREGLSRSAMPFFVTMVTSFFNASIVVMSYGFTWLSVYMFVHKIAMFSLGAFNGVKLGKEVILEDKYAVLLNITDRTKEIITELEKELGKPLEE
jgi:hypothetical protein